MSVRLVMIFLSLYLSWIPLTVLSNFYSSMMLYDRYFDALQEKNNFLCLESIVASKIYLSTRFQRVDFAVVIFRVIVSGE